MLFSAGTNGGRGLRPQLESLGDVPAHEVTDTKAEEEEENDENDARRSLHEVAEVAKVSQDGLKLIVPKTLRIHQIMAGRDGKSLRQRD
jgi:hypothetical protein